MRGVASKGWLSQALISGLFFSTLFEVVACSGLFVYFLHLSSFFVCNDKHVYLSLTYDVRGVVRTKGLHGWGLDLGG